MRPDTPWRIFSVAILIFVFYIFSFDPFNASLFLVSYLWTQSWSYGESLKKKKFRPAFYRLVMETYWAIEKLGRIGMALNYFIPVIFCYFLVYITSENFWVTPILGALCGAAMNFTLSNKVSQYFQAQKKSRSAFGPEEVLSESSHHIQNHQKDNE